jgi:hypothetical protein
MYYIFYILYMYIFLYILYALNFSGYNSLPPEFSIRFDFCAQLENQEPNPTTFQFTIVVIGYSVF